MIEQSTFSVEPWALRETGLDLDRLAQSESIFALANGHLGLRGNLDEGEPHGLPGTYVNGLYEVRPLPHAEPAYGDPEAGQTIVNVTNGKIIRLLLEDEPFDVRYGELRSHERVLDLRAGLLRRTVEWASPAGKAVRVTSTRLVSLAYRSLAAIQFEVEPLGEGPTPVVVQSELVANEPLPGGGEDPRAAAALSSPLVSEQSTAHDMRAVLVHVTKDSGLRLAAGMDHVADRPDVEATSESEDDLARVSGATEIPAGERLRFVKFLAYGFSSVRSEPAVRDQVEAALSEARHIGWDGLLAAQGSYLDEFWERADVELDGDAEVQQAVRVALFHVLQSGARAERRAIPAKGLTGPGYDGHAFWDTEAFVLPVLTYTEPGAAGDALRWRHSTLELARQRAAQLGLEGAAFPWRTIAGEECSGYWPAGTAAFHIGADIAYATSRYAAATGDEAFERDVGAELLMETARLWRSLGHHDPRGRFRIEGVTGPDEYSAVADNNVYTNLLAEHNLRAAADASKRYADVAARLGVDPEEAAAWRDAADAVVIPHDDALQVHAQAEGFTQHAVWDFAGTKPSEYPLLLNFPYFDLYRKQVVKQADLVLALHVRGDAFTDDEKARDFDYYERLTVRDSSLSACTQSVIAAEVGHLELAYDYLGEAALVDLDDLEHNTRDGLHIASLAGTWIAIVAGLGGLRDHRGNLSFAPRLPEAITRLRFRLEFQGRRLKVEVKPREAIYALLTGEPIEVEHHGERFEVPREQAITRPVPPAPVREAPRQPPGREPARRRRGRSNP